LKQHKKNIDTHVFKRENPRRNVMHYESPPRRRLREEEDEILKTLDEGKSNFYAYE
jgi:hypothetical protein